MKGLLTGIRPDITPAQMVALVIAGIPNILLLLGVELDPVQRSALDELTTLGVGLFGADALVRGARNYRDAKITAAAVASPTEPHDTVLRHERFNLPTPTHTHGRMPQVGDAAPFPATEGGGVVDDEERELLNELDAGLLPPDHEEFGEGEEPQSRRAPDDPDRT